MVRPGDEVLGVSCLEEKMSPSRNNERCGKAMGSAKRSDDKMCHWPALQRIIIFRQNFWRSNSSKAISLVCELAGWFSVLACWVVDSHRSFHEKGRDVSTHSTWNPCALELQG